VGDSGSHWSRLEITGVGGDVALRRPDAAGVAVPVPIASVLAAAEELHVLRDDIDGLPLLPLHLVFAPVQAAVDRHRASPLQVLPAAIGLAAEHRDVEVVGLVLPLPGGVVLP